MIGASDADAMGMQSRSDLLAVFASGAILLNEIGKMDITSVAAGTVVLKEERVEETLVFWDGAVGNNSEAHSED